MRTTLLGRPQLGGLGKSLSSLFAGLRVLVQVMIVAWATLAIYYFKLALALAALRAGSGFCSFHHLRFLSLWTTVDEPDCNSLVPRSGCVVGLNSSLA